MPVDIDVDPLRLKAALRDFVALSAIPAVSVGREPEAVVAGLADSLVEVLQLDLAFVRMNDPGGVAAIEVTRGSAATNLHESLGSHVGPISTGASREVALDLGDGSRSCQAVSIPIGVNGKGGLVVAASTRGDFPSAIDRVLLSLTANHAAIAFENARLIHERDQAEGGLRKARDELEARVVERTAELNVANEELSALRRVATLVAEAAAPSAILDAVAGEMQALLGADQVALNRFEPDTEIVVLAHRGLDLDRTPVGSRVSHEGENVTSIVRRTGRPARIENYEDAGGALAELARATGLRSSVSAPITVEGQVWGVVTASWKGDESPPSDTEDRMAKFAHLIDTAIANTEARGEVERLADEQAALRRVATLVAGGVPPEELFAAVAEEVGQLLPVTSAAMGRYDRDGMFTTVAAWSTGPVAFSVGRRWTPEGKNVTTLVLETGRPARIDDLTDASGPVGVAAREAGYRSAVGTPIIVEGRLWGVVTAASTAELPLPPDTETRLASFTELVATAVANTESRTALAVLADEQATLRRMATLVARGVPPAEIFSAVSEEAGRLVGSETAAVVRFEHDPPAIVVVGVGQSVPGIPIGTRSELDDGLASTEVFRTGRSARLDTRDWASVGGPLHEPGRRVGLSSTVASPISVEGRLWGTLSVSATAPLPLDTEERLEKFTELVATAIANAESREALAELVDEQAALRRVATLVAEGVPSAELFSWVTTEVAHVFLEVDPSLVASVIRFDPGPESVLVGASRGYEQEPLGARWAPKELYVSTRVLRTGRSARVDEADLDTSGGPDADVLRLRGFLFQVGSPVVVEGQLWGAMCLNSKQELPPDTEEHLEKFTELVATAIANAEGKRELAASRRRIVAASDDARRRIERDLHDGVQQQLVSLSLEVDRMAGDPPAGDRLKAQLASVTDNVGSVLDALVEIARGIHPAILAQGGLEAALNGLARRFAVPVELDARIDGPLPEEVEVAAYYVASEALTNVAKHAHASVVHIDVTTHDGNLTLAVRDDGVGGAALGEGSGLVGLRDRVEALGGTITIDSAPGEGTCVAVTLPIAAEPDQEIENFLGPPQELGSHTSPA